VYNKLREGGELILSSPLEIGFEALSCSANSLVLSFCACAIFATRRPVLTQWATAPRGNEAAGRGKVALNSN
jgi:hypothetical protein